MVYNMAEVTKHIYPTNISQTIRKTTYTDYVVKTVSQPNTDSDDIRPVNKAPVPFLRDNCLSSADPSLTLTPERLSRTHPAPVPSLRNNCSSSADPSLTLTPERSSRSHPASLVVSSSSTWREEILSATDPKLTVTPERLTKPKEILSDNDSLPVTKVTKHGPKQKQRVRFDIDDDHNLSNGRTSPADIPPPVNNNVNLVVNSPAKSTPRKEYCPQMYSNKPGMSVCDQELDVTHNEDDQSSDSSNSRPGSVENGIPKTNLTRPFHQQTPSPVETALKILTIRENEVTKPEPPKIVDFAPAHVRKCHAIRNVVVTRELDNRASAASDNYQFPFVDHTVSLDSEHVLARPEFNTTLKISEELRDLKASKPNVVECMKKKLKESEEVRTDINEKASCKVNRMRDQFSGLVGVDPDINKLCLEVEREITVKAKTKNSKSANKSSTTGQKSDPKAPDILEFYTDDRQREIPDFNLTSITIATETLSTADPTSAFDLYRHNRVWDTLYN